jgi:Rrf2 family protein
MLSKTALQAVRALVALAEIPEGAYVGAGALAREIGARENYLGKLLQQLSHEGLVHSQKGLGGGFRLARDPQSISLYDIVEPIEHISRWTGCFLGHDRCSSDAPCAVHRSWGAVRDAYLQFLRHTHLSDLSKHN